MVNSILIVDDEREIGIMLSEVINGTKVDQVFSGNEAISYLEQNSPDLIFLDLQLPEINGLEVLKHIRARELDSIVVMITAFATVEAAVEAMKIGANDFLCKPIQIYDLQRLVEQYTEESAMSISAKANSLEDVEKRHIASILTLNNGNRRKTAEDLEISLRTLYYKIKQYDLES